ncbi:cadherin-like beta sandwich domain-containing protein, partial [Ammoniphilus sp. CFH 90114]|uniref:cadherin-like beta sandwich domain-containing protein n=1 Tax=Ammoniphilus sp. CFH 90114 TaxID=2493665 RepID=UPI001024EAD4
FDAGVLSYTASVDHAVTSVDVTATVADADATVWIDGAEATSGQASNVTLSVGENVLNVVVTAQDDTKKTYTITITRAPSSNADLSNLTLSQGTLAPAFDAGVLTYSASVGNAVTDVDVTATIADANAKLQIDGKEATSGLASNVSLNVGENLISIEVTAQDGTSKTYTVTVTRAPSSNADLSNLTLSQGTLTPAFDAGTLVYNAIVEYAVTNVDVTATAADANATLRINGTDRNTLNIPLSVGPNPSVSIQVTAQDGTTKAYTVTVTRNPLPISDLVATKGNGEVQFAFSALTDATQVELEQSTDGTTWTPATTDALGSGSTSAKVTGLINGTKYYFRLVVTGGDREGYSNVVSAIPNAAPMAANDYYNTRWNVPLRIEASGLLKNDQDADGHDLVVEKISETVHGTVYVEAAGSFMYYPHEGFRGADQFTYRAYDGFDYSNEATVSLFVYDALTMDQVSGKPGKKVVVPVRLTSAGDLAGLQFDVSYDSRYLSLSTVQAGNLLTGIGSSTVQQDVYGSFDYHSLSNGDLRVIVANLGNVTIGEEAGILVNVEFDIQKAAFTLPDGYQIDLKLNGYVMTNNRGQELTEHFTSVDGGVKLDIDKIAPTITYTYTGHATERSVQVDVTPDGTGSDIARLKVEKGIQSASYFETKGTDILEEMAFDITENTTYTIYAQDEAGNESVQLIHVMGDVDFTRIVDVTDWLELINYVLERETPSAAQHMLADMNRDETLNVVDPVLLANVIMAGGYDEYLKR